jgi:hypothetical protein
MSQLTIGIGPMRVLTAAGHCLAGETVSCSYVKAG